MGETGGGRNYVIQTANVVIPTELLQHIGGVPLADSIQASGEDALMLPRTLSCHAPFTGLSTTTGGAPFEVTKLCPVMLTV